MKNAIALLLIPFLGWLFTAFGPWYLIIAAGFFGGLIVAHQWRALLIGFFSGTLLWALQLMLLEQGSASDLPSRMAQLIGLPSSTYLIIITVVLGGIVTGLGAAAGGALTQKKIQRKF
jgi:hypothetical protein